MERRVVKQLENDLGKGTVKFDCQQFVINNPIVFAHM